MNDDILVFDLGGTSLRAGRFSASLRRLTDIARASSDEVRGAGDPRPRLKAVLHRLAQALSLDAPSAVGMAAPGPTVDGFVSKLPSMFGPDFEGGLDFGAISRALWPQAPAFVCNDLTAAGYRFVDQGETDFGVLTLGTGVGGKLFVGGRPLLGRTGNGGEIGHWRVPGAPPIACDCGGIGHLSALAAGRGIVRLATWRAETAPGAPGGPFTAQSITDAYRAGDAWTCELMAISAEALGAALAVCALASGVERFFLTGSFAAGAGESYRAHAARAAAEHAWEFGVDWDAAVQLAPLGEETGLLGAGFYALAELSPR